jgi:hypothetical protein
MVYEPTILLPAPLAHDPGAIFDYFWPKWLLTVIVEYTNKAGGLGAAEKGATGWKYKWHDTTVTEIRAYIALKLYMTIYKAPTEEFY